MYASSTTTTASFFLLASRYSISLRAVTVPEGLFGIADVEDAAVGVGLDHGLDIVAEIFAQRDASGLGADEFGRAAAVAGIAHHPASRRRSEGATDAMQRVARPGEGRDVRLLDAFHLRDGGDEIALFAERRIAAAVRSDLGHRLQPVLARAQRILIARDADRIGIHRRAARLPCRASMRCCASCAMAYSL